MHPCLHYFIVIVSESLLHSQILIWRYVSMQNKRHNAAHTLNGVRARLSHSIKGITWISLWTSWYCKAFVSYKSRLRSFFLLITKNRLISEHEQSVTFLQATCARFINFIDSPGHGYFSYDTKCNSSYPLFIINCNIYSPLATSTWLKIEHIQRSFM